MVPMVVLLWHESVICASDLSIHQDHLLIHSVKTMATPLISCDDVAYGAVASGIAASEIGAEEKGPKEKAPANSAAAFRNII
ncbi:hypothetical protein EB241_10425 [Erwinia psidii]|uniref:Uncharacterized protein n=1 Tax=Erwinia psidii TaxID=69224 RepID=A0A3N6SE52_9GAMM|nr:hypothetical protein EB241_10425 [Erwinia psidii]